MTTLLYVLFVASVVAYLADLFFSLGLNNPSGAVVFSGMIYCVNRLREIRE